MVLYSIGSPLGTTIQTAELDDDSVTAAKLNVVGIDGTTGKVTAINSTNFTSLDASNLTGIPFDLVLKEAGTITIQTTTTAFDTDFTDIDFSASELTALDVIEIQLFGAKQGSNSVQINFRPDLENTTSNPTGNTSNILQGTSGIVYCKGQLTQEPNTNTKVLGVFIQDNSVDTMNVSRTNIDSGDANIFTTAFTLRLNLKFSSADTSNTIIKYQVFVRKGQ